MEKYMPKFEEDYRTELGEAIPYSIVDFAKDYAFQEHGKLNHKYGGYLPYSFHLNLVARMGEKFITLVPKDKRDEVLASCYLHDVLEDCHVSYNDLKKNFGETIAEIVYAVTNEKGRTRKERANDVYYKGIRETEGATFVKLCDRLANVLYSCMTSSSQFEMYKKENYWFHQYLFDVSYEKMFCL